MESIYTELALYGSKIECARTDNVLSPISEICDGTISLMKHPSSLLLKLYVLKRGACSCVLAHGAGRCSGVDLMTVRIIDIIEI